MISVLILTKNEEMDLPGCLNSVKWCDDIHVFDSFSNDSTAEIAIQGGVSFTQRKFGGYASQRNAGLELNFKYPWILILDADERIPNELCVAMKQRISIVQESVSAFRIRRRDFLGNTWLKHSQISPFYIRLVRKGMVKYHREINEVMEVNGDIEEIENVYFDHYPFSKGFSYWLSKHNVYSSMEAERWVDENCGNVTFSIKKAIFSRDFNDRRFNQKGLFYKIPFRPAVKWIYMVIGRRAFLDGRAGLTYATLQSIYEYFIVIKSKELLKSRRDSGLDS